MLRWSLILSSLWLAATVEAKRPDRSPEIEPVISALGIRMDPGTQLTPEQKRIAHEAGMRLVSLCPDCRLSTIAEEGPCGWARVNRQVIRSAAASGLSEDEIVETYVRTYGDVILAVPKDRGFAMASWVVPYVASALGLGLAFFVGWRIRRRERVAVTETTPSSEPIDPEVWTELKTELEDLD